MPINDLIVAQYCRGIDRWTPFGADAETASLLRRLTAILDRLEPQGDDNYHCIWVKVPAPSFDEYVAYYYADDEQEDMNDEQRLAEIRTEYERDYPYPDTWHQLHTKHFTYKDGKEFYAMFVDDTYVFSINDVNARAEYDGTDLLQWAVEQAELFVQSVANGTYRAMLNAIPYIYREGKIQRKVLWQCVPKEKDMFTEPYDNDETNRFLQSFAEEKVVGNYLPRMTARTFFEACAAIYRALKRETAIKTYRYQETDAEKERYQGITPKEMYYANADSRDDGLSRVPMDDADAFDEWVHRKGPYYKFNGSHPWEIIPSFIIMWSLHFYPRKSDCGYYFALDGASDVRAPETIVAANALVKAGYPVQVVNFDTIAERIKGDDWLNIVPSKTAFLRENTITLPSGDDGITVAQYAVWDVPVYFVGKETSSSIARETPDFNRGEG